jgi:hypothetical protein
MSPLRLSRRFAILIVPPALCVCGAYLGEGPDCRIDGEPVSLPRVLAETSGLAVGILNPDFVWTHNDSGHDPILYALDAQGQIRAEVEIEGNNRDWEDMDRGRCDLGSCFYVADTGDNNERRQSPSLYRIAEPDPTEDARVDAERYRMLFPDGPRDVEAMYVLPGERVFFVTKGRNHAVTIYRYPPPLRPDEVVTLQVVQTLTEGPVAPPRMVTGASATLDGSQVVIRTYETLEFFEVTDDERLSRLTDSRVDLRALRESQGEGVAFAGNERVILSSESGFASRPSIVSLVCTIE